MTVVLWPRVIHSGDMCVVVATVSAAGRLSQRLLAWGGGLRLDRPVIEFRAYPESFVKVTDDKSCATLVSQLASQDASQDAAVQAALTAAR